MRETPPDVEPLVVPAWWDPKARRLVLDPTTFKVGLLMITRDAFVYVVDDREVVAAKLRDIGVSWPNDRKHAIDVNVGEISFRFYLSPPIKYAPTLTADRIDTLTGVLSPAAVGGLAGGAVGTALSALSSLGDVLEAPGLLAQWRRGRRNWKLIRDRLDTGAPSS